MRKRYAQKIMRWCGDIFTAIAVMGGVRYSAFASDYHANEDSFEDEALVEETVDLSDTLQRVDLEYRSHPVMLLLWHPHMIKMHLMPVWWRHSRITRAV